MSESKKTTLKILCAWAMLLMVASCRNVIPASSHRNLPSEPKSFIVYYGSSQKRFSHVDWAIVQDSYRPVPFGKSVYFAYLSLGEIDPETNISKELSAIPGELSRVTLSRNPFWHSRVADIRRDSFRQALFRQIQRDLRNRFGGIFLDTLDSPLEYRKEHPKKGKGIRRAVKSFIETVHASYPGVRIIVNRGFEILPSLAPEISGVLYEDFCSRFDEETKSYVSVPEDERRSFLHLIDEAKKRNPALIVLALDYDDPAHPVFQKRCDQISRRDGFPHYVSDWTLSTSASQRK
ncbi:MAG: endo alpha-1,4 polygalactosaminidase [Leptospirillum sp.]